MSKEMENTEPFTFDHCQHQNASMCTSYPPQNQEATHQDQGVMSKEMENTEPFTFHHRQHQNASICTSYPPQNQKAMHQDQGVLSREMETVEPFTFDDPQYQSASLVAGQSETLHVHQKGSGVSGLYAQPFTFDLPRHQEAYTGQPMGSNFWPMPVGQPEAHHTHLQASGQLSGINAPLFTTYMPQHQEATHQDQGFMSSETDGKKISFQSLLLDDSIDMETVDRLTLDLLQHQNSSSEQFMGSSYGWQSPSLYVHQQSPGQFSGVNAALVFAGNSEPMQDHTQNTSLYQHHQAAVVAEKSPFQALPCRQNYRRSATSRADFIPQLYPYTTYGSTASPFLRQNLEHSNRQNEIQHLQQVNEHGTQITDHSQGIGTDRLQVALIPWQYRELSEQQQNISTTEDFEVLNSQVLPSTGHAKDKGKALATEEFSAGGKTKAADSIVEEANQSQFNNNNVRTYCTVHSSEQSCRDSRFSCRPAAFDMKMSENFQKKCKNVISQIEKRIKEDGDIIAPLAADIWKRHDYSAYKLNFAGLHTMDFRSISQRLKENVFETLYDFVKEVQSMLKAVADEFWFSCEMVGEMETVHNLFFQHLENMFENTDFSRLKEEVKFSSPFTEGFLSKNWQGRKG